MSDITWHLRVACGHDSRSVDGCVTCEGADEIEALRELLRLALASIPAPAIDASAGCVDPVAWMGDGTFISDATKRTGLPAFVARYPTPLYAAPQQRQPLTDDELDVVIREQWGQLLGSMVQAHRAFARAVEAAHGIKETK